MEQWIWHRLRHLKLDECLGNSYSPFHVPGMSYINLTRAPWQTEKLYLFENDKIKPVNDQQWLIHPHDHAYNFTTNVISGYVEDLTFERTDMHNPEAQLFSEHGWDSALNGGTGLANCHGINEPLEFMQGAGYGPGTSYRHEAEDIHTLVLPDTGYTVLFLQQFADSQESSTFVRQQDSVDLKCEYEVMTMDELQRVLGIVVLEMIKEAGR